MDLEIAIRRQTMLEFIDKIEGDATEIETLRDSLNSTTTKHIQIYNFGQVFNDSGISKEEMVLFIYMLFRKESLTAAKCISKEEFMIYIFWRWKFSALEEEYNEVKQFVKMCMEDDSSTFIEFENHASSQITTQVEAFFEELLNGNLNQYILNAKAKMNNPKKQSLVLH